MEVRVDLLGTRRVQEVFLAAFDLAETCEQHTASLPDDVLEAVRALRRAADRGQEGYERLEPPTDGGSSW